jgi:hypothetical protein
MTDNSKTYGFDVIGEMIGDNHKAIARFTCHKCPTVLDLTIKSGNKLMPELLAHNARQKGWEAHNTHKNRALCPACKALKIPNDPDSEIKKMIAKNANAGDTAVSSGVVPFREPTIEQRARIRELLNLHFDEMDGAYHDEWDDQVVAEKLGLPRILVERLREAAYGPIRVTPEMVAARKQHDALNQKLNDIDASFNLLIEQVKQDMIAMRKELRAMDVKLFQKVA